MRRVVRHLQGLLWSNVAVQVTDACARHLHVRLTDVLQQPTTAFIQQLQESTGGAVGGVDAETLRLCSCMYEATLLALQLGHTDDLELIRKLAVLASTVPAQHGFVVIAQPVSDRRAMIARKALKSG